MPTPLSPMQGPDGGAGGWSPVPTEPRAPTPACIPARERPLPDPAAFRLCVIPDSAPPYDDEMRAGPPPAERSLAQAAPGARSPGPAGSVAATGLASPMASGSPDDHDEPADEPARPAGGDSEPQRTGSGDGAPAPGEAGHGPSAEPGWPSQFAQVLAETLAGSRPARQITPWTTERARTHIRRLGPLLSLERQPRVRRILTSRPSTDVVESPPVRYPTLPRKGATPLAGTRIGVPTNLGTPEAGPGEILARTLKELSSLGATLVELAVPGDPFGALGPIEFYTDALSYHSQWYPSEVALYKLPAAQMLGLIEASHLSALNYLALHRQRAALQASWKATLAENKLDAAALLVSLADPPTRSNPELASPVTNPENSKLLTYLFSYLGFPVVTVPGGTSSRTHLPVGIQLAGAPFSEANLIQLAVDLQAHFPHYEESPSFA